MKKFLFSVAILASVMAISCNSQTSKNEKSAPKIEKQSETKSTDQKIVNTKPVRLTKQDFLAKVMDYESNPSEWNFRGELPCVIDFYADWCAPCRMTSPILEELAAEYAGKINVYKIDVQKEQELAAVFGIQGIPAFLYCPVEGNPSMSSGIARSKEETKQMFIDQIENVLLKNNTNTNL
ncbi:MAG: thiol reductase thioredoxin [Bacteroidales bacterium]|nr:thiol reductase thioredoxin [Bacteroidales bacterium]